MSYAIQLENVFADDILKEEHDKWINIWRPCGCHVFVSCALTNEYKLRELLLHTHNLSKHFLSEHRSVYHVFTHGQPFSSV
jgi:hypothetical protein